MNKQFQIELKSLEEFICEAVKTKPTDDLLFQYQKLNDAELFDYAQNNRVASIVAHFIINVLGDKTPAHWTFAHNSVQEQISEYLKELDRLAEIFHQKKIKIVILKNGGIARGIVACRGCCPMGDLDLLIEQDDFTVAHKILITEGFILKFRNPLLKANLNNVWREGGAEYFKPLSTGKKLWLELSWRTISGRWISPGQEPDTAELISRSMEIAGTKVRLLSLEDNLLQVCLHTAKHSYVRAPGFRLHLDVERLVAKQKINWGLFVKTAKHLQVRIPVFFSLLIPKILFNTAVPDDVLDELAPSKLKHRLIFNKIIRAGIFDPEQKKFGVINYFFFNALLYDNTSLLLKNLFFHAQTIQELSKLLFKRINT